MHHYKKLVRVLCQQLLPSHEYTSLLGSISFQSFHKVLFCNTMFFKLVLNYSPNSFYIFQVMVISFMGLCYFSVIIIYISFCQNNYHKFQFRLSPSKLSSQHMFHHSFFQYGFCFHIKLQLILICVCTKAINIQQLSYSWILI